MSPEQKEQGIFNPDVNPGNPDYRDLRDVNLNLVVDRSLRRVLR